MALSARPTPACWRLRSAALALRVVLVLAPELSWAEPYTRGFWDESVATHTGRIALRANAYRSQRSYSLDSATSEFARQDLVAALSLSPLADLTLYSALGLTRVALPGTTARARGGVGDMDVGAAYRLISDVDAPARLSLQLALTLPTYSNRSATPQPFLGDGTQEATLGLTGQVLLLPSAPLGTRLLAVGSLAVRYRSARYSAALPWSAGVALDAVESRGPRARLEFWGFQSLRTDPTSPADFAAAIAERRNGAGASAAINAVNPSIANLRVALGHSLTDRLVFELAFTQAIAGENAPRGTSWGLTLTHAFDLLDHRADTGDTRARAEHSQVTPPVHALVGIVTDVNDRLGVVRIDAGSLGGVRAGTPVDLVAAGPAAIRGQRDAAGQKVAEGRVLSVRPQAAVIEITRYLAERWIEVGFVARARLE